MTLQIPAEVTTDVCTVKRTLLIEVGVSELPISFHPTPLDRGRGHLVSRQEPKSIPSEWSFSFLLAWRQTLQHFSGSLEYVFSCNIPSFRQFIAVKLRRKIEDSTFWNISCTIQKFSGDLTRGLLWSCCNISFFYHGTASPGGDGAKSQDTGHSRGPEISVNQKVQRLQF